MFPVLVIFVAALVRALTLAHISYCGTDRSSSAVDRLDQLVPHLPLRDVMQDLYCTDRSTKETCAR